jgi:hypothetical protein
MRKRLACLLLMLALLLTQAASAGQCRGCRRVAAHDPHVHLTVFFFAASRLQLLPAPQGCCGHHDADHEDDRDDCDAWREDTPGPEDGDSTDQHDSTVVYLPDSLCHGWLFERVTPTAADAVPAPLTLLMLGSGLPGNATPVSCTQFPSPHLLVAGCPPYLRILNLLI